jgi:hypothetical protein
LASCIASSSMCRRRLPPASWCGYYRTGTCPRSISTPSPPAGRHNRPRCATPSKRCVTTWPNIRAAPCGYLAKFIPGQDICQRNRGGIAGYFGAAYCLLYSALPAGRTPTRCKYIPVSSAAASLPPTVGLSPNRQHYHRFIYREY